MQHIPQPHEIYRHFKGNTYQVVTLAEHSETGEILVIYQAMYGDYKIYARPLSMFQEKVDKVKYPQAAQEFRFEPVNMAAAGANAVSGMQFRQHHETQAVSELTASEHKVLAGSAAVSENKGTSVQEQNTEQEEIPNLDPLVIEFLDADTYEERLNILTGLHHRITDDMINVMAMATDIEVKPGDVEERYAELKSCLLKLERFECNRLR